MTAVHCRSRRRFLSVLAASAASGTTAAESPSGIPGIATSQEGASSTAGSAAIDQGQPVFSRTGPNALIYGEAEGYPVPPRRRAIAEGNPWAPGERVGAFSHLDEIYPTHRIQRAATPSRFYRPSGDASDRQSEVLRDYLARHPVTGLLVVKDERILFEHYQYGRTDVDRLLGQSMTKSVTGLLVGLALADGALRSVDDAPEAYVADFKGSQYGRTPLRALLHMSSGVDFGEERDNGRDLGTLWRDMVLGAGLFGRQGTVASIRKFDRRITPPGTRYHYASIEADVLAVVLRKVLRRPLSEYLRDRLWLPMGCEADATWLVDAEGFELGHFGFSAVLRDYARLGRLLASDGVCDGKQLIPAEWLHEATTVRTQDAYLAPGRSMRLGYGYLLWLLPGERRQFALVGQCGQRICIDPRSRVVMVHTALEDIPEAWALWSAVSERLA